MYRLDTEFKDQQLILKGKLPSDRMRQQAELAVQQALPELELHNQIIAVQVPPDPGLIAAEVDRLTQIFNQMDSVIIDTHYTENQIVVSGHIRNTQELGKIRQAFTTIPGIEQVIITLTPKAFPIDQRIYFNHDSATLNVKDIQEKVATIKTFLQIYPDMRLQIIGHADRTGLETHNRNLAYNRAEAVAEVLINQGIPKDRLVIMGDKDFPPGVEPRDSLWKSRCVRFARVMASTD
ncbi:MAG: OmpA family protein [Synechococcaceae cyanobacterium RL_1_2]|nr:OmpA family protein [Synechococcaceae cyanobacterium RL_1_2]